MTPDADLPVIRAQRFLEGLRVVWLGRACLTAEGAAYLGVPWYRQPNVPRQVDAYAIPDEAAS